MRRLQKTLKDYSPPAFVSKYYVASGTRGIVNIDDKPEVGQNREGRRQHQHWYSATEDSESPSTTRSVRGASTTMTSLVKLHSHSEDLGNLNTPKVISVPSYVHV